VRIAALRHAELMGAQSEGRQIIADARGRPVLAPVRVPGLEDCAQAIRALDAEAERRILGVASLARQSNDNALIAQAALAQASGKPAPEGLAEALARRAAIDALRAIANRIAAQIGTMPAANLTGFDPLPRLWGRADMAKISQLPLVTEPDGSETFVVLKDGMAQRVPGAALIGAAGEVSLEQVQAAASAAQTSAQAAQASAQSAAQDASDAQAQAQAATQKADATAAASLRSCCQAQPLRDRLCLHHRAGPFGSLRLPCGGRGLHMARRLCRGLRPCRGRSARRRAGAHPQGRQGAGGHLHHHARRHHHRQQPGRDPRGPWRAHHPRRPCHARYRRGPDRPHPDRNPHMTILLMEGFDLYSGANGPPGLPPTGRSA
jgi:hypothetical protein